MMSIPVQTIGTEPSDAVNTTCPYCGVGCGVRVTPAASGWQVTGDPDHPANRGRLCIKGSHLADTLDMRPRLQQPMLGRAEQATPTEWPTALDQIASAIQTAVAQYGPESVAFYVSGQLLTEDYYVVNKFVKGYLGTANIDTNSRLCMSSAVTAHKRAFGEDIVAGNYADFEQADLIVLVGSNTAWCHPILFQRIMAAREARPSLKLVVIDPRATATTEGADLHIALRAGRDVHLFNGLLQYLVQQGLTDHDFVQQSTVGLDALLAASEAQADPVEVAAQCGVAVDTILKFYQWFAQHRNVMTLFSMGVNQSSQGTDKANSIINCHLVTGRVSGNGMGAFSMTGQPNAMGGREVGGLSNMLAAHLDLDNATHRQLVQQFWNSPVIAQRPGLKAVELFEAVERGQIKVLWIMATNPVVSLPNSDQVRRALQQCPMVIVSEVNRHTDTTEFADVLLPAQAWGEKEGTVTNSERYISRQRRFLPVSEQIKPDWWAISQVAQRLGWGGFDYQSAQDIFVEHARLTATGNGLPAQRSQVSAFRYLNLSGLTDLDEQAYAQLAPVQWPVMASGQGTPRLYDQQPFSHADGRARFVATVAQLPQQLPDDDFPLILNTGRIRDQWHTMSRTGQAAALAQHIAEPFVEIHPADALMHGIRAHDLVEVRSRWGSCVVRAQLSEASRRGQVFVPIHWNGQVASDARIGAVVNPVVDPVSGEPEFKHTPVAIRPFYGRWQALLWVRDQYVPRPEALNASFTWWVNVRASQAARLELMGRQPVATVMQQLRGLFDDQADDTFADAEWLIYEDMQLDTLHVIIVQDQRLMAAFYLAPPDLLPNREWVAGLFTRNRLSALQRRALLAGLPMTQVQDDGPLVCSCFKVGQAAIERLIRSQNITDAKQVTAALKAGGNCGSCLPEIRGLIRSCQIDA